MLNSVWVPSASSSAPQIMRKNVFRMFFNEPEAFLRHFHYIWSHEVGVLITPFYGWEIETREVERLTHGYPGSRCQGQPWRSSTAETLRYFQGYKLGTGNFKVSLCCLMKTHPSLASSFTIRPCSWCLASWRWHAHRGHRHPQLWFSCQVCRSIVGHRCWESLYLKLGTGLFVGVHFLSPDIRQPLGLLKKQKPI